MSPACWPPVKPGRNCRIRQTCPGANWVWRWRCATMPWPAPTENWQAIPPKPLCSKRRRRPGSQTPHGLRVLAFALKRLPAVPDALDAAALESGLTFIGLAGLIDPPRPEAAEAGDA